MTLLDREGEQADDDAAVQRLGIPGTVGNFGWDEGIAIAGKKGLVVHGARPWRIVQQN